jgi:hypothetical protein
MKVKLSQLKYDRERWIRKDLDINWVRTLTDLLKAGTKLDPIVIDQDGNIVDGVHRYHAYMEYFGPRYGYDIDIEVIQIKMPEDPIDWMIKSFRDYGTSSQLPLTLSDKRKIAAKYITEREADHLPEELIQLLGFSYEIGQEFVTKVRALPPLKPLPIPKKEEPKEVERTDRAKKKGVKLPPTVEEHLRNQKLEFMYKVAQMDLFINDHSFAMYLSPKEKDEVRKLIAKLQKIL